MIPVMVGRPVYMSIGAVRNPRPNIITLAQASTEARAILSVTEPETVGSYVRPTLTAPCFTGGTQPMVIQALAEALATFIEEN